MARNDHAGLSRRQMLARGLAIGGAVWAAPTITAVALTPANAASPSGPEEPPEKPPETPPEQPPETPPENPPTQPPENPPTQPPDNPPEQPPKTPEKPSRTPRDEGPGDKPDDDVTAGGLPDTGPGGLAGTLGIGGALAVGGAAAYMAARRNKDEADDPLTG